MEGGGDSYPGNDKPTRRKEKVNVNNDNNNDDDKKEAELTKLCREWSVQMTHTS